MTCSVTSTELSAQTGPPKQARSEHFNTGNTSGKANGWHTDGKGKRPGTVLELEMGCDKGTV